MIGFIKKIKDLLSLSDRIHMIQNELNELETRIGLSVNEHSKSFEKRIQDMTFAYTKNLDDTKSDYLKRYLEQRMNGMQYDLSQIPIKLQLMQDKIDTLRIEKIDEE